MALSRSEGPLVWIDCEMTGLNPKMDSILSIACFITDAQLNLVEVNGYDAIIHHPQSSLDQMDEWCKRTHGSSGLSEAVLKSRTNAEEAANALLEYIHRLIPEQGEALLAGSSVHADKMFLLEKPWEKVLQHLHYRILDVSAIKEGARRWCKSEVLDGYPKNLKKGKHEARADILESIEEARYFRKCFERIEQT